ncbi:MAG: metal ABC transporter permease [Planctomycetota bacterium]|nr:MAG: metal ABC transporter permease [Planctomycetota bacterium]
MFELFHHLLLEPLEQRFFLKALLAGCLVAITCSVVGCLVVLRRMAFLGDAIAHAMIAGVAAAYLLLRIGFGGAPHAPAMLIGALIAALLTVVLVRMVAGRGRLKDDTAIGIMYTGIFALGVVMVSLWQHLIHIDIVHFMIGDVLGVSDADLIMVGGIAALVLSLIIIGFRSLQAVSFDPVMAASIGIPVLLWDMLLTGAVALVVVSAVTIVGVILVIGLLITPAATAYLLSERLSRMMLLAAGFAVSAVVLGLYISMWLDTTGGGTIVLVATAQFAGVFVLAPRHGMLAQLRAARSHVPDEVCEDILGSLLRSPNHQAGLAQLSHYLSHDRRLLRRGLRQLLRQEAIAAVQEQWALTPIGHRRAERLRRSHRLWESFLHRVGVPHDDLHNHAELLEHLHHPEALEYLDQVLGHPTRDPHGKRIPSILATDSDEPVPLDLLSEGYCGEVAILGPEARGLDLIPGETVRVSRSAAADGDWQLRSEERSITISPAQAHAILLRLVPCPIQPDQGKHA